MTGIVCTDPQICTWVMMNKNEETLKENFKFKSGDAPHDVHDYTWACQRVYRTCIYCFGLRAVDRPGHEHYVYYFVQGGPIAPQWPHSLLDCRCSPTTCGGMHL